MNSTGTGAAFVSLANAPISQSSQPSWRSAQGTIDIALRCDPHVALFLHERGDCGVSLGVRLASAQLAGAAAAMSRFFGFDYFRYIALRQCRACLSHQVEIVALIRA
ncbi:MAG: hypothetical protein JO166_15555 [Deltaproteobacteria bacterium]|nr:hypothetical protein [Deltaproteobacteria bacterium]